MYVYVYLYLYVMYSKTPITVVDALSIITLLGPFFIPKARHTSNVILISREKEKTFSSTLSGSVSRSLQSNWQKADMRKAMFFLQMLIFSYALELHRKKVKTPISS